MHRCRPVWARERCRISPPRFLAECCRRQLNHGSFVLLYFRLFTFFLICIEFVYLYFPILFCLSGGNVTSAGWQVTLCDTTWHVSSSSGVATVRTAIHLLLISQVIGCEDRLRNDLYCVEWGVKLYSNQSNQHRCCYRSTGQTDGHRTVTWTGRLTPAAYSVGSQYSEIYSERRKL